MKCFLVSLLIVFGLNVVAQKSVDLKAKKVIRKAIRSAGGKGGKLNFSFTREQFDFNIELYREPYDYRNTFSQTYKDSSGNLIKDLDTTLFVRDDIVTLFLRSVNGNIVKLNAQDVKRFSAALHFAASFAMLPYQLTNPALNANYIGEIKIEGQSFHKIKVWFDKGKTGKDKRDVFCYWFNTDTGFLDYLAYNDGGPRFGKVINRQVSRGFSLQDYEIYQILNESLDISEYDKSFSSGQVMYFSKIEHSNYKAR